MKLIWGGSFARAFRRAVRKNPRLREVIQATLRLLAEDPFAPRLATHKLKGKLSGSWACTVTYDLRIVFDFVKEGSMKPKPSSCWRSAHTTRSTETCP